MNIRLIVDTIIGNYSLNYKAKLLVNLFEGMWTSMNMSGIILLCLISLLTSINIVLLIQKIHRMKGIRGIHFITGGTSVVALAGTGCASCGLPLISFLGLSGSVAALPFKGQELSYVSLTLLSISIFTLSRNKSSNICKIKR